MTTEPGAPTDLRQATAWLAAADRVTVRTGAGISTDSGIPDFRGPQGVWTKNPAAQRMSTRANHVAEPELRVAVWRARAEHPAWTAVPNAGHEALGLPSSGRAGCGKRPAGTYRRIRPSGGRFCR